MLLRDLPPTPPGASSPSGRGRCVEASGAGLRAVCPPAVAPLLAGHCSIAGRPRRGRPRVVIRLSSGVQPSALVSRFVLALQPRMLSPCMLPAGFVLLPRSLLGWLVGLAACF